MNYSIVKALPTLLAAASIGSCSGGGSDVNVGSNFGIDATPAAQGSQAQGGGAASGGSGTELNITNTNEQTQVVTQGVGDVGTGQEDTDEPSPGAEELYFEGFEADPIGREDEFYAGTETILDNRRFISLNLVKGSVDLVAGKDVFFNKPCPSGEACVDMDGHNNVGSYPASLFETRPIDILHSGWHVVNFTTMGSDREPDKSHTIVISVLPYLREKTINVGGMDTRFEHTLRFRVPDAGVQVKISFELRDIGDNAGPLLDDIKLSRE